MEGFEAKPRRRPQARIEGCPSDGLQKFVRISEPTVDGVLLYFDDKLTLDKDV